MAVVYIISGILILSGLLVLAISVGVSRQAKAMEQILLEAQREHDSLNVKRLRSLK
jgi:hypothetical protein